MMNFVTMECYKRLFSVTALIIISLSPMSGAETIEESPAEFPASAYQLKDLAYDVCLDLFWEPDEMDTCADIFKNSTKEVAPDAAELQLICRTKKEATYSIEPSEEWQLVMLVPDNAYGDICTSILKAPNRTGSLRCIYSINYNYTFWTTTLYKNGGHSKWHRGQNLPPWNMKDMNFTVEEPNFEYVKKNNTAQYTAYFNIGVVGEINSCTVFNVRNVCDKDDLGWPDERTIRPNLPENETKVLIIMKDLPINDTCMLKIYNHDHLEKPAYVKKYVTPLPAKVDLPELATNVTLDAVATETGWDIKVGWARPKRNPVKYHLKLLAPDRIRSVNLSGIETGYTFKDVVGAEGAPFNVTLHSYAHDGKAKTVGLGQLPRRPNFKAVIIMGSWSVLLTVAAAATGALVWWRRWKTARSPKFYFTATQDFKINMEALIESAPKPAVEDRWELRSEKLALHEVIGEGAFGVVRRGIISPGGQDVAVKMLKDFPSAEEIRSFRAEMELMKSVGAHPHIVSLVGCCSGRRPLIVAEYCSRGDLLSFLRCSWDVMVSKRNASYYNNNIENVDYRNEIFKKLKDSTSPVVFNRLYELQGVCDSDLTALDLLSFCRQIAMGMEFLASNRVVHRDLAARNILVTGNRTLKIADFGLSRDVYQENQYKQKGNGKMPVKWMALESLTHRIYTTQSDVWSFGVVIWEVVTVGAAPYAEVAAARLPRLLKAGYRMPRPNNCSKQLYEVMSSCWRAKPRERPTFAELHQQLDELLNSACADDYLSLELDYEPPPTPKAQRYIRMLLRGNRVWARGDSYERPLKGVQSNHYTTPPCGNAYHTNCLKNAWHTAGSDYRAADKAAICFNTK